MVTKLQDAVIVGGLLGDTHIQKTTASQTDAGCASVIA